MNVYEFKQELKDNTNLVLNTIILADGDYVLVHSDGTYDVEKIKYSKKDHCLIEKPEDEIDEEKKAGPVNKNRRDS